MRPARGSMSRRWRSAVALAPVGSETTSLVVGTGASELADTLRLFGGSVIEEEPASVDVPAASLDIVFLLNDGLFSTSASRTGESTWTAQRRVLQSCHESLKPGGHLLLAAPNRFGLAAFAGRRDDLTGLRFVSLLPRPAADLYTRLRHGGPYRHRTRGLGGYARLLREAGFATPVTHLPWPDLQAWSATVHDVSRHPDRDYRLPAAHPRRALAAGLLRWLRPLGLDLAVHPAFVLVAGKPTGAGGDASAPSLVGRIVRSERMEIPPGLMIKHRSYKLHFAAGGKYFRLPLTARALEGQRREEAALERLAKHPIGRFTPHSNRLRKVGGVTFSVADHLTHDVARTEEAQRDRLERAFEVLFADARTASLEETETWSRVFSRKNRDAFRRLGCEEFLEKFEINTALRRVPVGPVHGDLHPGNLLASDGRLVIIDWDRFEEPAPLFLDALHGLSAYVDRHARRPGRPLSGWIDPSTVRALLDRDPRIPLLERADATLGEATWAEAVCVHQLSWLSRQMEFRVRNLGWHETGTRYRQRLALCVSRLEEGRPG